MPRPSRAVEIEVALLKAALEHPRDLIAYVAGRMGLSRAAVGARARELVVREYLSKKGSTRPVYNLGRKRRAEFVYKLRGLAEDRVWSNDIAPLLANIAPNVLDICHYGLTEMANNAIDHSDGHQLTIRLNRTDQRIYLEVADDGVGIFNKIAAALNLPDKRLALLELAKGKFTTDSARHSGEGVFFTSRVFDGFTIFSGELVFNHNDGQSHDRLVELDQDEFLAGTLVQMDIAVDTTRTLKQVFDAYSSGPDDYAFAKTVVPVALARVGHENLMSRSQAKRLLQRVERFRTVVLDFAGIERVGQAFADEVFRVFAMAHPDVELQPIHAAAEVQQMILRAQSHQG